MGRSARTACLLGMVVLSSIPSGASVTIVLQNGFAPGQGQPTYWGTADSWLQESSKTKNYGADPFLRVRWNDGRNDAIVMRFDLTGQIPANQRVLSAKLSLYYSSASMSSDEAIEIRPYRVDPSKPWYENVYNGTSGYGVNFRWRDNGQTQEWTAQDGGWWDKIDDGNTTVWIQDEDGQVGAPHYPIKPGAWAEFGVTQSVRNWYAGATNNGFSLYAVGYQGTHVYCYGLFCSRDHTTAWARPKLEITYEGALAPMAEANGPYTVSLGGSVNFSAAGSYDPDGGSITSWLWDLDDDTQYDDASGASVNVTYRYLTTNLHLVPGMHTIRLKVTDDENESATDTASLRISRPYPPGDMNCDGLINNQDIDPFILVLLGAWPDYASYYAAWPDCDAMLADCNYDGYVNNQDIDPFVALLFHP